MRDLRATQREVAAAILGDAPIDEPLARYREQFFLRHVAVLEEDFAPVVRTMGHDAFHDLARRYLAAHPPTSFTLRDLGHAFASFIEDPVLRDAARLAWAHVESFDAADGPLLDPASLAGVPEDAWPHARIVLAPALRRLVLAHPTQRHVVVFRRRETDLSACAFGLLDEIERGATLAEACERAAPPRDELADWFRAWTSAGWISRVYFPPSLREPP